MFVLFLLNFTFYSHQTDTTQVYPQPEVVVTATRTPINSIDAPSRVTQVDVDEMQRSGFDNTKSMLSFVDGIFVKDNGPAQLGTVSLRGTAAEQTLFLFDGISLNNVQNGQLDLFLVPSSNLQSIEISQGGSSALYGANAVGGVIDFQSKTPINNFVRIDLGGGSYANQMMDAEVSEGINDARFNLMVQRKRGVNDFDFTFTGGSRNFPMRYTGGDYVEDMQSLKIALPSSIGMTSFLIQNVSADRGTPYAISDSTFETTSRETDENTMAVLKNAGNFGSFDYSASAGFIYSYLKYTDPAYATDDYYKTLSTQPAAQLSYSDTKFSGAVGVDAELDRGESDKMASIKDRNRIGAFASGDYELRKDLDIETRLFGALRYDGYSRFGNTFNPKAGINIKPLADIPIHLRANIGTSFRIPTFNELYYYDPIFDQFGNQNLKPESSTDFDLGAAAELEGNRAPLYANLDADYYHIDTRDGIVWQELTNTSWTPENLKEIVSSGVELSLCFSYSSIFALKGNYFFGKSLDVSDPLDPAAYKKQLLYIPQQQSSLVAEATPGIFTFTAAIRYVGGRFYTSDNTASLPPYAVTYASASARIEAGPLELFPKISVDDLFNRRYEVIYEYPVPGRTYWLELGIQFNQSK
ncbi:MAG TPA: TonB-dependent receptor [Candidatus Acidoferrales bacterium]|nr:TonB-dependent receptor [Candidatus Acidoferrales bacterium]